MHNIDTSHNLTKLKINRNKNLITMLEIENKIIKLEMVIKYRLLVHNMKYIEELNKINDIERKQLYEFDIQRHINIKELTHGINNMNISVDDVKKDIMSLKPVFLKTVDSIKTLTKCMPKTVIIHNIKTIPIMQEHEKRCRA